MKQYFSIGEIAKLHNLTIETLRHYDRCDLLKPTYINEKTGYRYYCTKSFNKIDLIKQCRAIGLSLEEIKELISDYKSLDSILKTINNQKDIIDNKIKELMSIKSSIGSLEEEITESMEVGINNIFVKYNEERYFMKYKNTKRYTQEFEMTLRKLLLDAEKKYNKYKLNVSFSVDFEKFKQTKSIDYYKTLIKLDYDDYKFSDKDEILTIAKGNYLTIYFDDTYSDTKKYYDMLYEYIIKNNIQVCGDFYEIYIMTRVGNDGEERSLAKIDILIKDE